MSKKADIKNCELECTFSEDCETSHYPEDKTNTIGNYIGSGPILRLNIYEKFYPGYTIPSEHPLSKKDGASAQAHHLICSEAMDDDDWPIVCWVFGYDINCHENGVILPASLEVACEFGVPLHRGPHSATETGISYINYVSAVENKIFPILEGALEGNFCDKRDEIISQLNKISNEIWINVRNFTWTLTFGGKSFIPGLPTGCQNAKSIKTFRKNMGEFCNGQNDKLGGFHAVTTPIGKFFEERGLGETKTFIPRLTFVV